MINLNYTDDFSDAEKLASKLLASGLSENTCKAKACMFVKVFAALSTITDADRTEAPLAFFVPGRIEFLGKHTDYAGGHTMVTAAERGF
ncbi:MAG: galactokinase family protein, partial [Thermoguttaceae bacterium]